MNYSYATPDEFLQGNSSKYGVKQILTIPRDIEIATEFIIPTTVLFL